MRITRDIRSLSEFKQNASKYVKQVQETGEPMVLTVNGRASVVVQDAESYQRLLDANEKAENAAILSKRLDKLRNDGKTVPAAEVFKKLSKKYDIDLDDA